MKYLSTRKDEWLQKYSGIGTEREKEKVKSNEKGYGLEWWEKDGKWESKKAGGVSVEGFGRERK